VVNRRKACPAGAAAGIAPERCLPLVGAQLSSAGGFLPVPQRAMDIGAEAVQIFNTNPRTWRPRVQVPDEIEAFGAGLRAHGLPLFFHSIYLINLASPDEELRRRSAQALALALSTGALAGAKAVVTHVGSHRGETVEAERRVVRSISEAVDLAESSLAAGQGTAGQTPAQPGDTTLPALLLETGTGSGNTLGGTLEELQTLLTLEEAVGLASRLPLGICIDTAHLFAAGYPVHDDRGLDDLVTRLRSLGLLDRIGLVHLNDSKTPFAARRDQHANPGEGLIGYEGLARFVRHPALARTPFILEVPGNAGHGPDAANIALVKSMRARGGGPFEPARGSGRPESARAIAPPSVGEELPAPPAPPESGGNGRERRG
jgi:deoxyribonuclease IV